jgi:hypothetical protein
VSTDQAKDLDEAAEDRPPDRHRATELQEIIAVVLLSVTAILTAWSGPPRGSKPRDTTVTR